MANKYGRNQRRKHLSTIAELKRQNCMAEAKIEELQERLTHVRQEVFATCIEKSDRLTDAVERAANLMFSRLDPALADVASKIINQQRFQVRPYWSLQNDWCESLNVITIRGTIPSLNYQFQVI